MEWLIVTGIIIFGIPALRFILYWLEKLLKDESGMDNR